MDKATAVAQMSDTVRSVYQTREAATMVAPLQQASVRREVSYTAKA